MSCNEEKNVQSAPEERLHEEHLSQLVWFKHINEEGPVESDNRHNVPFHDEVDIQLGLSIMPHSIQRKGMMGSGKDLSGKLTFGECQLSGYENPKKPQPELFPDMVFWPFGVPDGTLRSIDCTIDHTFKSAGTWAPQLLSPRRGIFTKVYKRGSVGRSIDITRYSGYQELKQYLARIFGIEGQLGDLQSIGWQIFYVDHENDVLLVGGDPWEEFVSCVRHIKIISQELQQMSLDGDFGNAIQPNHVCGSSDGIFSFAYSGTGQNTAVARSRCMDTLIGISDLNTQRGCRLLLNPRWPSFQDGRRLKRPREQGLPDEDSSDDSDPDNLFKMKVPRLDDDFSLKRKQTSPHLSFFQGMDIPQSSSLANLMRSNFWQASRSFVQNLAAADLSQQLDPPAPQFHQQNSLQFNAQCLSFPLQLGQRPESPAISLSSINQPKQELSSTSSSNISQFRKLLRKVTYNIESCSNNQPELSSDSGHDEEVQSHPREELSTGTEIDIQLRLALMPHSVIMKE